MKKDLVSGILLSGAIFLSSCSEEPDQVQKFEVLRQCNGATCSLELAPVVETVQSNILGQSRVLKREKLAPDSYDIVWHSVPAFADNNTILNLGLPGCSGGSCTGLSNPTAGNFTPNQSADVYLTGTMTVGGKQYNLSSENVSGGAFFINAIDEIGYIISNITESPDEPGFWLVDSSLADDTVVNYQITGDIGSCTIVYFFSGKVTGTTGTVFIESGSSLGDTLAVKNCAPGSHTITVNFSHNGESVSQNYVIVVS